jgi:predicted ATPase
MLSSPTPLLRCVAIENFKSIAKCRVDLAPLTILVGRNGSGKSNFLDALKFVADALQTSLDHAIRSRGGIDDVRRRSTGHPRNFGIRLELLLPNLHRADFTFEIASRPGGSFAVKNEELNVVSPSGSRTANYHREERRVSSESHTTMPPVLDDRLFLVNAAGLPEFRPAYDALVAMGFYNLDPEAMREPQAPDAGELLHHDGSNIASVVGRLSAHPSDVLARISDYLRQIVPAVESVERAPLGPRETLQFLQKVKGSKYPWRFYASSMSDGTLRALGALVAVTQFAEGAQTVRLVGIEEPETALHPAAAGALMDALREATKHTQVIVTTHSADLLDQVDIDRDGLLVVVSTDGVTRIAPADEASINVVREHLYSVGELLRADQLAPNPTSLEEQDQMELFSTGTPAQ